MALKTGKNIELVAPAGNFEKLQAAVHYGAHAVYFGGQQYNLRATTKNFSIHEIEQAVAYAHTHNVKAIFLLNAFLHESDIPVVTEYIQHIKHIPFDAIMVSDPGMSLLVKEHLNVPLHLSTQMSTLNHLAAKFWASHGISRIVLARETTLEEIKQIREHTDIELEIFCHGALCISYSGRCLLSRYLSGRDANQGNCSHPCRWKYSLVEEKRPGNHLDIIEYSCGTEILSSKDLCLINKLPDYINAGVNAFKIEGRMKSLYYTANVTRIYRHAIDTFLNGGDSNRYSDFWHNELDLVSHRPYTEDLFNEFNNQTFDGVPYIKKTLFMGYCIDQQKNLVKVFNPIYKGDSYDAIYPVVNNQINDSPVTVIDILVDGNSVSMAQPNTIATIIFDKPLGQWAILRKRL
ncbi:MAG TPA: peptidase U32 family protein [Spirochaetota bacterium]|nr:peptidase U32 family protein [Spirochaetota bacterium]